MNDDQITSSLKDEQPEDGVNPRETHQRAANGRRFVPQVSLLTLLLAMALFAVLLVYWQTFQSIERLERQMPGLRSVARELKVDDPSLFAVVEKKGQWYGENICEIHVPADQPYRLCLALDAIDDDGFPDPLRIVSLSSGKHRVEICYDTEGAESIVRVLVDDQAVIEETRPKDWEPRAGSSGGMPFSHSTQYQEDEPVVLFRRRFLVSSGPSKARKFVDPITPNAGILVWVESEKTE